MALDGLVNSAEKAKSNWWKWVLGVVITLVLSLATWRLSILISEYRRLRTAKELAEEQAADLNVKAQVEENEAVTKALAAEATAIREGIAANRKELAEYGDEIALAKTAVDRAKGWKELRKQATGNGEQG
jgi:hypothetical protein